MAVNTTFCPCLRVQTTANSMSRFWTAAMATSDHLNCTWPLKSVALRTRAASRSGLMALGCFAHPPVWVNLHVHRRSMRLARSLATNLAAGCALAVDDMTIGAANGQPNGSANTTRDMRWEALSGSTRAVPFEMRAAGVWPARRGRRRCSRSRCAANSSNGHTGTPPMCKG